MNAIIQAQPQSRALSAGEVREQINLIQTVMKSVMKENTHFGIIPGCKQPTLYKAGSEVLLTTFRIGTRVEVNDLSADGEIRYQVKVIGIHQTTGVVMGEGIGECSSCEEKYKWRSAICDEEYDDTPESKRRIKYTSKWNNQIRAKEVTRVKQVRTEPADLANTILKMAKKRAQIDFTLTALGASDIFTQDIEDMPEELRQSAVEDGQSAPVGAPLEHEEMKAAANVQDLAKVMNGLNQDEKKKYSAYFNQRRKELMEAAS